MRHRGVGSIVGTAGLVASALLVAGAVLVVLGDDATPDLRWDPALVVADDTIGELAPGEARAAEAARQQRLLIGLHGVPNLVGAGDVVTLGVELYNATEETIALDPCPAYRVTFSPSLGGALEQVPDEALVEMVGRLRCDEAAELRPDESVAFEMPFELDATAFTQPRTEGAVAFELWPTLDLFRPRSMVTGIIVERGNRAFVEGLPPGVVPPGLSPGFGSIPPPED